MIQNLVLLNEIRLRIAYGPMHEIKNNKSMAGNQAQKPRKAGGLMEHNVSENTILQHPLSAEEKSKQKSLNSKN